MCSLWPGSRQDPNCSSEKLTKDLGQGQGLRWVSAA